MRNQFNINSLVNITLATLVYFMSSSAHACAVCGFGEDGSRYGYIVTTILLTATPLILFFSGVYFIYHRSKKLNEDSTN